MSRRSGLLMALTSAALGALRDPPIELFFALWNGSGRLPNDAARVIQEQWRPGLACLLVDLLQMPLPPDNPGHRRVLALLERVTRERHGTDLAAWQRWVWSLPYEPHADYALFRGLLLENIDRRMRAFFPPGVTSRIRLDRILWGGVRVNGIPPLVNPATIAAGDARYLDDRNVVFGIAWNGEARAYPKRILAWHELARDAVGGLPLAVVYCTLCGTVIPYRTDAVGGPFTLGTSGLLYESSKLMFDEETLSLWPTLEGRPAVGRLAALPPGEIPQLESAPVVTTTWKEWRTEHPQTRVLSLETGHRRDYGEGAAYREYFATDRLMFPVSREDRRLKNKDEVLVIRRPGRPPLAFAARLLRSRRVLMHEDLAVLTSPDGASRVYQVGAVRLSAWKGGEVLDEAGAAWGVTEAALETANRSSRLARVPAHRAFWFGWHAQFPDTELIK